RERAGRGAFGPGPRDICGARLPMCRYGKFVPAMNYWADKSTWLTLEIRKSCFHATENYVFYALRPSHASARPPVDTDHTLPPSDKVIRFIKRLRFNVNSASGADLRLTIRVRRA